MGKFQFQLPIYHLSPLNHKRCAQIRQERAGEGQDTVHLTVWAPAVLYAPAILLVVGTCACVGSRREPAAGFRPLDLANDHLLKVPYTDTSMLLASGQQPRLGFFMHLVQPCPGGLLLLPGDLGRLWPRLS